MSKRSTRLWMGVSLAVAMAVALAAGWAASHGDRLGGALRATARWSFVLFWLAYTGRPFATLFGSRFNALAWHARDFGLSFAAAHSVHLGLVALLLCRMSKPFPREPLIFFAVAAIFVYLLALLSVDRLAAMLGPRICKAVRRIGSAYIALAFLVDFARNPFGGGITHAAQYLPFLALTAAGIVLHEAAGLKRLTLQHGWPLLGRKVLHP